MFLLTIRFFPENANANMSETSFLRTSFLFNVFKYNPLYPGAQGDCVIFYKSLS